MRTTREGVTIIRWPDIQGKPDGAAAVIEAWQKAYNRFVERAPPFRRHYKVMCSRGRNFSFTWAKTHDGYLTGDLVYEDLSIVLTERMEGAMRIMWGKEGPAFYAPVRVELVPPVITERGIELQERRGPSLPQAEDVEGLQVSRWFSLSISDRERPPERLTHDTFGSAIVTSMKSHSHYRGEMSEGTAWLFELRLTFLGRFHHQGESLDRTIQPYPSAVVIRNEHVPVPLAEVEQAPTGSNPQ